HQPLHAASDHDAGGNDKQVRAAGRAAGSLHHYWDTEFVRALGKTPQAAAERLIARTTPRQIGEWSAGDPARWAMQSFRAARTHAYGKLPAPGADGVRELPPEYVANANRVVAQQLARAGVRLAMVLNEALR
ncbi:MAG: S1/P1 nuclease, partial [Rhodocyclaceae bacterium]|nr:S1/P1 nuclease [Rhodocyclaceae bacterium]